MRHLALALLPLVFLGVMAEGASRVAFRRLHGHSYDEHHAFLPHPELVFQNNPRYFPWKGWPRQRFEFFFIRPLDDANPSERLWVLGGSTSAAQPDGSDWPAILQGMEAGAAVRVVNMGHEGYGTGQVRWLYEHEHDRVRPAAVVVFDGWNYRGSMDSRYGFQPLNAVSRFDRWPRRLSAALLNHSAAYSSAFVYYAKHHRGDPCGSTLRFPEMAEWEAELRGTLSEMARRDRVFLVVFPGLAMRDDVRPVLGPQPDQRCVAVRFAFHRAEYDDRIAVLTRAGQQAGVTVLDARQRYLGLDPATHASYFRDFCHQNREGNDFLAHVLARELTRHGALPSS